MWTRRKVAGGLLASPFLALMPKPANADPIKFSKPIRYIAPFAPAGSTDIVARLISEPLSRRLNQKVFVDNRPGAGGLVGTRIAVQSPPDGCTLVGVSFNFLIYPSLFADMDFDIKKDLAPVTRVLIYPSVMSIPADSPYRTVADLVEDARKNPGKVTFASSGVGTAAHIAGEVLKRETKTSMVHVPYRGGSLANTDLMAGLVSMHFGAVGPAIEFIRAGRFRALAVGTAERIPALPDVPTMLESGYPDFVINEFQGILAPAATPPEIVEYLGQEIVEVLRTDDIKKKFDQQGALIVASTPAEFATYIRDESEKWTRVAKEAGIKPQ